MLEVRQLVLNALDLGQVIGADHQGPAVGVAQHVQMRLAAIARIERHPHQVGGGSAGKQIGRLDRIVFQHADAVAGLQAQAQERIGQPEAAAPGFGKSIAAVAVHDRFEIGVMSRRTAHLCSHVHAAFPP